MICNEVMAMFSECRIGSHVYQLVADDIFDCNPHPLLIILVLFAFYWAVSVRLKPNRQPSSHQRCNSIRQVSTSEQPSRRRHSNGCHSVNSAGHQSQEMCQATKGIDTGDCIAPTTSKKTAFVIDVEVKFTELEGTKYHQLVFTMYAIQVHGKASLPSSAPRASRPDMLRICIPHTANTVHSVSVNGSLSVSRLSHKTLGSTWRIKPGVTLEPAVMEAPIIPSDDGTGQFTLTIDQSMTSELSFHLPADGSMHRTVEWKINTDLHCNNTASNKPPFSNTTLLTPNYCHAHTMASQSPAISQLAE